MDELLVDAITLVAVPKAQPPPIAIKLQKNANFIKRLTTTLALADFLFQMVVLVISISCCIFLPLIDAVWFFTSTLHRKIRHLLER
ncbi:MAG: hypothetical protein ACP5O1_05950 [Phycisphaerae bacterium]